jgi:hypothetical protein
MRLSLCSVTLAVTLSSVCLAQPWELGASGGYGWYHDPSIANASGSAQAGMPSRAAFGMTFTQNMYNYVGGEIRYLFRFGGPQLKSSGVEANQDGHTNLVTYDFLFYTSSKEIQNSSLRGRGSRHQSVHGSGTPFSRRRPATSQLRIVEAGESG